MMTKIARLDVRQGDRLLREVALDTGCVRIGPRLDDAGLRSHVDLERVLTFADAQLIEDESVGAHRHDGTRMPTAGGQGRDRHERQFETTTSWRGVASTRMECPS
jgi:hypothetical protein